MLFKNTICERSTVRNEYEELPANDWETVEDILYEFFSQEDGFVVLTLNKITGNIRYIQTAFVSGGLTVQLGIESPEGTRLVEKYCSKEECSMIFREFFNTANLQDLKNYSEVKF